jgi:pimeloyl-ACP methyl ester carboxylesterase
MARVEGEAEQRFRRAEQAAWRHFGVAPRERTVRVEKLGLDLRVLEVGEGEPVLFVHGGGSLASSWSSMLRGWRGGRAVAVDRPGCGLSDGFSYDGVDLRRHAVDVLEGVLDRLGVARAALVGNSMGGLWSLWLAIDRPERVSRLALIGCPALLLDTSAPLPMRLLSVPWLGRRMMRMQPPTPANLRKLFGRMGHTAPLPEELLAAAAAAGSLPTYEQGWLTLLHNVLSPFGKRVTLGADDLARVGQPVHFIWGSDDPFGGPNVGERACKILRKGTLEVLGRGHLPWIDAPEACRDAVQRFLAETPIPAAA